MSYQPRDPKTWDDYPGAGREYAWFALAGVATVLALVVYGVASLVTRLRLLFVAAFVVLVVAAAFSTSASASSARWVPGSVMYVEETDASNLMEKVVDQAYCNGIARFGKRGEFPDETFHVFDCSFTRDDIYCTRVRVWSVRARQVDRFRLKIPNMTTC